MSKALVFVCGDDLPDLVLLDLRLPGTSGLEVLERIQRIDASIPVIMMTAYGEVKTAVRAA